MQTDGDQPERQEPQESMAPETLEAFQAEYKALSDALEKHALTTYQALALAVVVGGALALYKSGGTGQAGLGGVVLVYGIAMAVIGLNFIWLQPRVRATPCHPDYLCYRHGGALA